ncbi:Tad domain-containing protein [Prosthecomicrobium sp. N25]|uniref:Tad domain-containing protein n=1 Tax=Prosthecomicrobium sp. N25 TaxID=3129254 RepID=UPI003076A1A3
MAQFPCAARLSKTIECGSGGIVMRNRGIVGFRRRIVSAWRPLRSATERYPRVTLAVFALAVFAFVGTAVDYSNRALARADLQEALDAASLSAVKDIDMKSDDEVRKTIQAMIERRLVPDQDLASLEVAVDRKSKRLRCKASVRVDTTITALIGPAFHEVAAASDTSVAVAMAMPR